LTNKGKQNNMAKPKSKIELDLSNTMQYKLRLVKTIEEKTKLIDEANPMLMAFGKALKPYKPYLTYEDNV
jgi:hypothetical protein